MARQTICDVCGKPTERIALKLYKTQFGKDHSEYTDHADVGTCCVLKINEISWSPRRRKEKVDVGAQERAA